MTIVRNAFTRIAMALSLIAAFSFTATASELITFNETFDGEGDHDSAPPIVLEGLDNPGWSYASGVKARITLEDGALNLRNDGHEVSFTVVSRVIGAGSFEEVLKLKDVVLGDADAPAGLTAAQIILVHTTQGGLNFQLMMSEDGGSPGQWTLAIMQNGIALSHGAAKVLRTTVDSGQDIAIKVRWNQNTKRVQLLYDDDTASEDDFVTVAEFVYAGPAMKAGSATLIVQRSAGEGQATVNVDSWTLKKLN